MRTIIGRKKDPKGLERPERQRSEKRNPLQRGSASKKVLRAGESGEGETVWQRAAKMNDEAARLVGRGQLEEALRVLRRAEALLEVVLW
jgi:hypothetical protein